MRALLDTNILISYLLTPKKQSSISIIVEAMLGQMFTCLLPEELLEELVQAISTKKHLAEKVTRQDIEVMVTALRAVAEIVPSITDPIPAVTRDPKDDYLLAYALVGQADYLVTGDRDLLSLNQVEQVQIISPKDFVEVLRQHLGWE
jgi:hypothetical protein